MLCELESPLEIAGREWPRGGCREHASCGGGMGDFVYPHVACKYTNLGIRTCGQKRGCVDVPSNGWHRQWFGGNL